MNMRRFLVGAVFTVIAVSGCTGNDSQTGPPPTTARAPTGDASTTSSPTPIVGGPPAGWQDKFTPEQLAAYRVALRRWQQYTDFTNQIYAQGENTPRARAVFREYDLGWQAQIATLIGTYEKGGLRLEEPPDPLWTYARSVRLGDGASTGDLVIVQCTDYSRLRYTQNGKVVENKPDHVVTPLLVEMTKPEGHGWLFVRGKLKDRAACVG